MTPEELAALVADLRAGDQLPRRVVVNAEGYACNPWRARIEHGILPALCFVRGDGWTLGAPVNLAGVAFALWAGSWVAVCELPNPDLARASAN